MNEKLVSQLEEKTGFELSGISFILSLVLLFFLYKSIRKDIPDNLRRNPNIWFVVGLPYVNVGMFVVKFKGFVLLAAMMLTIFLETLIYLSFIDWFSERMQIGLMVLLTIVPYIVLIYKKSNLSIKSR